jgi:hypothetical protein
VVGDGTGAPTTFSGKFGKILNPDDGVTGGKFTVAVKRGISIFQG